VNQPGAILRCGVHVPRLRLSRAAIAEAMAWANPPAKSAARGARGPAKGAGGDALVTPMQGTIVKIVAGEGAVVKAGDTVVILEAMKMEQPLTAHKDGTVTGLAVTVGQTVTAGAPICELKD